MPEIITPAQVERRLIDLSKEYDESHESLVSAEKGYAKAKTEWEIESAKARMQIKRRALEAGNKLTVSEIEDEALLRCQDQFMALNTSEAILRAERANAARIRVQADLARSVGTLVKSALG